MVQYLQMIPEEIKKQLAHLHEVYIGADNNQELTRLEEELADLLTDKSILDSSPFKKFLLESERKLNELNALLMNDESILNDKGILLSKERNLWRLIQRSFSVENKDASIEMIIKTIKNL